MAKGGARAGAGRPKGSKNLRPFSYYWSEEERQEYAEFVKDAYKEDMRVLTFVGEQLFGKAPASIDVTSDGEQIQPLLVKFLDDKADNGVAG